MVYLIHFEKPYHHAQHYIGWALDLDARLKAHKQGNGANLLQVVSEAGITWKLARVWVGGRGLERTLKNRKNARLLCPYCSGADAYHRGPATLPAYILAIPEVIS